jgi:uncharacterized protein (UPF0548 family)
MWSLHHPQREAVSAFLTQQSALEFSYPNVGASRDWEELPAGFDVDVNRVCLGRGERVFVAACGALRRWTMFPAPWTKIWPEDAPIETGTTIAMLANGNGLWWLNACRIVYTIDEMDRPTRRFGFAYGTLPGHVERGEERFSIEWLEDDTVWYDLRAFSQPRYWPVKLAKPLARGLQRRFGVQSKAAMVHAVARECCA